MDRLLALAERQHGLISLSQARSMGLSQQAVHGRSTSQLWEHVTDEVLRRRGVPVGRAQRLMAAVLDSGPGSVASFATGAAWWRVPGPPLEPIHLVRASRTRRPSRMEALIHTVRRLPERWMTELDGIPIARPELVALHLFASEPYGRAERWVEGMWSMRLLSGPSLVRLLDDLGARGRNGIAGVRRYMEERGDGYIPAATGIESRATQVLRDAGIRVTRQVDVGGHETWTGRVDLKVIDVPVVIEVQSERHHAALVDRIADEKRLSQLSADGFLVVEVWDTEVWTNPAAFIERVRSAVAQARSVLQITRKPL